MTRETDAAAHAQWLSSGDPRQFERLVKHFQGPVFGFLARMGISSGDAQDLAQDVFLRLWTARDRYDPSRGQVSTWLWSIARNVSLNRLSQSQYRQQFSHDDFDAALETTVATGQGGDPGIAFQARNELQQIDRAIATLSTADRLVIALIYVQELSSADAATLSDCSTGAFRVRLSRARQRLLETLNQNEQVSHANE